MAEPAVVDDNRAKEEDRLENGSPATSEKAIPPSVKPGFFSSARIFGAIDKERGDLALLACCFVTGLVDAGVFSNWGVFVGMQTGNTVILGLSTAGLPNNPRAWLTTLVSIISFLAGAFLTFRISKWISEQGPNANRALASALFIIQGLFIILAAGLATPSGLIPQNPASGGRHHRASESVIDNIMIVALIPPLALQSGCQIATSRLLGFNELPINVLTSTYCDIMGDFKLLAVNNVKRNRRVLAVLLLLAGAIVSGWLMRSSGGLESVFWIGGGIKILTGTAVFCFL